MREADVRGEKGEGEEEGRGEGEWDGNGGKLYATRLCLYSRLLAICTLGR